MPAGKLVFSGMELVKSSKCGSSVRISVCRGTSTGGRTEVDSDVMIEEENEEEEGWEEQRYGYLVSPPAGSGRD